MYRFDSSTTGRIGRSASLRLATRPNFQMSKYSEFDSQIRNCSLADLLARVKGQDSWMFDRPSLYERRKKRRNILEIKDQLETTTSSATSATSSSTNATTATSISTNPSISTKVVSRTTNVETTSLSSLSTSTLSIASSSSSASKPKPLVPPKPKIYRASSSRSSSSQQPPRSTSSSARPQEQLYSSSSSSSQASLLLRFSKNSSKESVDISSKDAPTRSKAAPSLDTLRTKLPSRYIGLVSSESPVAPHFNLSTHPKRLSVLREANDDDDEDDEDDDDDDDGGDGGSGLRNPQDVKNRKMSHSSEGVIGNGACDVGGDDDGDDEAYQADVAKALDLIQEELQQLKEMDRALFGRLFLIGSDIVKLQGQEGTDPDSLNELDQQSISDLSPSTSLVSTPADAQSEEP